MLCPKCGFDQSSSNEDGQPHISCQKCDVVFAKITLDCPRCKHVSNGLEIKKPNNCPECGVDVNVFLASRKPLQVDKPVVQSTPKPVPTATPTTTTCPACNGLVAYGAKNCPHCGKSKPAPPPKKLANRRHIFFALTVLLLLFVLAGQAPNGSGTGGVSTEFKNQASVIINANGYLCAEVESAFKPSEDQFELTCKLYRQGSSESQTYLLNTVSGKVRIK
jgi:hypothetical protein